MGTVCLLERHALGSEPVEKGCMYERIAVATSRVGSLYVGMDAEDVRAIRHGTGYLHPYLPNSSGGPCFPWHMTCVTV